MELLNALSSKKERPGSPAARLKEGLLVLFVFEFREPLKDERVRLIGQLGDQRQVITTEAIGIMIVIRVLGTSTRKPPLSSRVRRVAQSQKAAMTTMVVDQSENSSPVKSPSKMWRLSD